MVPPQRSVLLALVLLSPGLAAGLPGAQPGLPWPVWSKPLGPGEALGVAPAAGAGAFVAGGSPEGAWLARLGPDGTLAWRVSEADASWLGVAALPAGSAVVAGAELAGARPAPALASFGPDGAPQWRSALRGPGTFRSAAADARGVVAAGDRGLDALVARWGVDGALLWQRTLGSGVEEHGTGVALAPDGSAFVVGWSYDGVRNRMLAWRLDAQGHVLWQRTVAWPGGSMRAYAASTDAQGRLLAAGAVGGSGLGAPFLAVLGADGGTLALRSYPGLPGPGAAAVAGDALGGALLAGAAREDGFALRVTAAGDPAWTLALEAVPSAAGLDAAGVLLAGSVRGQGMAQRLADAPVHPP